MTDTSTNWIDYLISLSPVAQTGIWAGVVLIAAWMLKEPLKNLVEKIVVRVENGDNITTPWISLQRKSKLERLDVAERKNAGAEVKPTKTIITKITPILEEEWVTKRQKVYSENRNLFLTHVLSPSEKEGQLFDIFIYLIGHKDRQLDDIQKAEFFLGHYWGNSVFSETQKNGMIGLKTSAYGPFLCLCKVFLNDGSEILLDRYVDFEMGKKD